MKHIGPVLVAMIVMLAAQLGWQTYAPYGMETALGIASGAGAIAAMSVTLMLATRPRLLEPFFGGLDRMYGAHKWLGVAALALMIGHNTLEPELENAVGETNLGEIASDLGEFAFNGFIGLILISWIKRVPFTRLELPWPLWRFSHRFMGLLFAIAAFHQLAIDKPAELNPSFDLYMDVLSVLGILAWLFTQFVAPLVRSRPFEVIDVVRHPTVTEMTLRPTERAIRWRPGQFAFVSVPGADMPEAHPFTIASAPDSSGNVRLAVKALGGWTATLADRLRPGQLARLEGPYGRFRFKPKVRLQVWLAGGVGITPFLAWAQALSCSDSREVALIWSVATQEDAFARDLLAQISARCPGFSFHVLVSQTQGRLTARQLSGLVSFPIRDCELFYCGPTGLLTTILTGLSEMDQRPRRVHHERFELR